MKRILMIGEFNSSSETQTATQAALGHAIAHRNLEITSEWLPSRKANAATIAAADGVFLAPGGYEDEQSVEEAIRFARENNIPVIGTCGGFQSMILEFARNVLGYENAAHEEQGGEEGDLFISRLMCSLRGKKMRINLKEGSRVAAMYGALTAEENYYCNFGVNPLYVPAIEKSELRIVGSDDEGVVRVAELPDHKFYLGTLFVPQVTSSLDHPHPLITGFVRAVSTP